MAGNIESPATSSEIPFGTTSKTRRLHPLLLLVAGILLIASAYLSAGATGALIVLWGEVVLALTCAMR